MTKAREWSEEEKQNIKENLRYDSETGNLFWTTLGYYGRRTKGPAGCIYNTGYRGIKIWLKGKRFFYINHRVVWFLNYGYVPEMLDHIDGDRLNNRVENLRPATKSLNSRNSKVVGNIKYKGVCLDKGKYRSRVVKDNKQIQLGMFETPEEAARAYDKFVEEELSPLERQFSKTNEGMGLYDDDT
tara:strand:+ start:62 stop:616 length:555 start_codon:yes stop_codon:yes gene_type:complete